MSAEANARIAHLASDPAVHRAFRWFHLHQAQLRRWHIELLGIPAPPFGESARAAWFLKRFQELGLDNAHLDQAGNALAELPSAVPARDDSPVVLLSAHLDTVFPAGTSIGVRESGSRILAPGACDNGAGLTALLAVAAALQEARLSPRTTLLFAANVGEEGEGNLRGMRHLFTGSPYARRIATAFALEGAGNSALVTRALASRRFRITVTGPGGHSWTDAGALNPILLLARALLALEPLQHTAAPRITLNVGQISGGTSINSIPESASALLDLRSADGTQLAAAEATLRSILEHQILRTPYPNTAPVPAPHPTLNVELVGDRPAGALCPDSPLLETMRAVDRHLNLSTDLGLGSTDANIPLSLGVPAAAMGTGGSSGGIHTVAEWYDPAGRDIALRRILLALLDASCWVAEAKPV